jgi:hypothetical protein
MSTALTDLLTNLLTETMMLRHMTCYACWTETLYLRHAACDGLHSGIWVRGGNPWAGPRPADGAGQRPGWIMSGS